MSEIRSYPEGVYIPDADGEILDLLRNLRRMRPRSTEQSTEEDSADE